MPEAKQIQATQSESDSKEFTREVLRNVYRQLFKTPVPVGTQLPDNYQSGEDLRGKLCQHVANAGSELSAPSSTDLPREEVNRMFTDLCAESGTMIFIPYALSNGQWKGLRRALGGEDYALLRKIKDGVAKDSAGPDAYGVLKVGELELGLLYQWLFNPTDTKQAHNYLHALKKAARKAEMKPRECGVDAVEAVLGVLFNDIKFTGVSWMDFEHKFPIVSLEFQPGVVEQIARFVRDTDLNELEPYEGGGVCFVDQPRDKDNFCY
ncbi:MULTISPECIES: hypothetical protein [unclassified Corallococcus]|uniref:hypothetical protein n=1 Tax=unclassified Corallococcus TaxID=2685029 RepID=UPI001A8C12AF|nr:MULTISPECIES: hypothetical protein [unclassified Corallococcus]MBN9681583.1 hypothetical protein [Corallococcus sp. NCSPR001]WAS86842.1 hypothetical protein O0N60_07670 [Corallococcus sp. NCRR]